MHVVVHLLYKAHAFLKSGSTVDSVAGTRSIAMIEWTRNQTLSKLIPAVAIYISIARCMAIDLATKPGYLVLGVMIVLALAQLIGPSFFTRSVGFHVSCNGNCRDELQRQMRRIGTISTPPSLWLIPLDTILDQAVAKIHRFDSSLILRCESIKLNCSLLDDDNLKSAIDFAIQDLAVTDMVICSHSELHKKHETPRGHHRMRFQHLMHRVQQHLYRLHEHRQFLIDNVERLCDFPSVAHAIQDGCLSVHGLFYLADSGIFSLYHHETGQFSPLDENWSQLSIGSQALRPDSNNCL